MSHKLGSSSCCDMEDNVNSLALGKPLLCLKKEFIKGFIKGIVTGII